MTLTFYWYPACSSCKKAKKWLEENNIDFYPVHIVEETPSKEKILHLMSISEEPARRFFNTSGKVYRELNLKEKVKDASNEEMAEWLASNGMLIKRPIITDQKNVTIGFNEDLFNEKWLKN